MYKKNTSWKKKRKPKFEWNKKEGNFLKTEEETISRLKQAYESVDASKVNTFKDFPLSHKTLKGLKDCGYFKPTEIQRESIGLSLRGADILGAAQTGSGKTLAFIIPILETLYCQQWTRLDGVGALIITPTRELAYQIFETLRKVGQYHDFSAGLIIGGKDLHFEKKRMDKCNIIICTPGRLLHHMDENPLFDCGSMQVLVLDEADRCLDLGFEATMNNIIENLPPKRQTLLFSATQTKSVRDLARLSLKDPMYVSVHEHAKHSTPESLRQSYIVCELHEKTSMLWSFIKSHLKQKILIFMASCKQVKYYYEIFCHLRPGTTLLALYGTLHQLRRMSIYESFCRKSNAVMFATDIAARGLDFPEVNWVVQFDCPEDGNTYIHRAGRTARYHKGGESLLVLLPSEEKGMIEQLSQKKIPITKIQINPSKLQSPHRKIEAFLAKDHNLKESAQRAFVTYMKSVFLMKNKNVFNVHSLDTDSYSRSLGLAIPPRIRFLQKMIKQQRNQLENEDLIRKLDSNTRTNLVIHSEESGDSSAEEGREEEEEENSHVKSKSVSDKESFSFGNDDSDSELDILKIKRKDHELESEVLSEEENTSEVMKKKKALTKVAVAKKILKKKIVANKKTVFNDEGEVILDNAKEKVSSLAREYESEINGGIDLEEAKKVLREEDKHDKQRFREKIKAKHREEKLKMQKTKKQNKQAKFEAQDQDEDEEEEGDSNEDTDDDEGSEPDLSWLPDPDKVYSSKQKDTLDSQNSETSSESEDESYQEDEQQRHTPASLKRKSSLLSNTKKKKPREDQSLDTGLSLKEDEELALHLLQNIR